MQEFNGLQAILRITSQTLILKMEKSNSNKVEFKSPTVPTSGFPAKLTWSEQRHNHKLFRTYFAVRSSSFYVHFFIYFIWKACGIVSVHTQIDACCAVNLSNPWKFDITMDLYFWRQWPRFTLDIFILSATFNRIIYVSRWRWHRFSSSSSPICVCESESEMTQQLVSLPF